MAYAYHEKIARINLTTGTVTVEHLDPEVAKNSSVVAVWVPKSSMMKAAQL